MGRIIPGLGYTDTGKSIVPGLGYTDNGSGGGSEPSVDLPPSIFINANIVIKQGLNMLKNTASQSISALILDTAGAPVLTGTTTVYVTGDAGSQASAGTATYSGNGVWNFAPSQANTNYDEISFLFSSGATDAVNTNLTVFTTPELLATEAKQDTQKAETVLILADTAEIANLNDFNPASDDVAKVILVATTTTNTDMRGTDSANTLAPDNVGIAAIEVDTQDIQSQIGTAGAGLTAIDLPNQTMNITGSLSGSVGSVSGSVESVTGNVGGIVGTLNTLDDLDTEQNTQHQITQDALTTVDGKLPPALVSDRMNCNVDAIDDSNPSAVNLGASTKAMIDDVVATVGNTTSCTLTNIPAEADVLIDAVIFVTTGDLRGERKAITANTAGRVVTFDAMSGVLAQGDEVVVL